MKWVAEPKSADVLQILGASGYASAAGESYKSIEFWIGLPGLGSLPTPHFLAHQAHDTSSLQQILHALHIYGQCLCHEQLIELAVGSHQSR